MVAKFVNEEGVDEVIIGNVVIMLSLYVDDVVFLQILQEMHKSITFGILFF